MRLLSGILAGQDFSCILTGDDSLNRRPMNRIIEPLSQMGASIKSISGNGCAPLGISPGKLHGIRYNSKVASAQVKICHPSGRAVCRLPHRGDRACAFPKSYGIHAIRLWCRRFLPAKGRRILVRLCSSLPGTFRSGYPGTRRHFLSSLFHCYCPFGPRLPASY